MKAVLKTALFILLGCIITVTSLAQQRTSKVFDIGRQQKAGSLNHRH